jgi:tetratricopeptide (TPR) repeat protein
MKILRWFMICYILFLSTLPPVASGSANSSEELLFEANQAYKDGRFQDAVGGYLQLIENGTENGHIYYNLGNAYFRLGDLGRAILYYERAHLLIPRDADLNFNLSYALDQTRDAIPASQSFINQSFFGLDDVNLREMFFVFALLNFFFFGILFIRLFCKAEWTYYIFLILLISIIFGSISFGLKWYQLKSDDRAVILEDEVNVLAGPDPKDTTLFKIHKGAVVHYERAEDGWALINLSKDKRGWIKSTDLERILIRSP